MKLTTTSQPNITLKKIEQIWTLVSSTDQNFVVADGKNIVMYQVSLKAFLKKMLVKGLKSNVG